MKLLTGAGLAGLVLAAAAAPVAAISLTGSADHPPAAVATPSPGEDDATEGPDDATDQNAGTDQTTGAGHAAEASAPGRAHAAAMQAWAHCVAAAASGPKVAGSPVPPKLACGDKPMGPGRARHLAALPDTTAPHAAPPRPDHRSHGGHGHSHGKRR